MAELEWGIVSVTLRGVEPCPDAVHKYELGHSPDGRKPQDGEPYLKTISLLDRRTPFPDNVLMLYYDSSGNVKTFQIPGWRVCAVVYGYYNKEEEDDV